VSTTSLNGATDLRVGPQCLGPVLVVADDARVSGSQRAALTSAGHPALIATTFLAARHMLGARTVDAVVINLPLEGDGLTFLELIGSPRAGVDIAVVVVGCAKDPATMASTLARNGVDYMRSPCEPVDLVARLEVALCWLQAVRETGSAAHVRRAGAEALYSRLTPAEASVAARVAAGATNRAIASELFVTVKSVEFHLANIFRKLGTTNRTQVAVMLLAAPQLQGHASSFSGSG